MKRSMVNTGVDLNENDKTVMLQHARMNMRASAR